MKAATRNSKFEKLVNDTRNVPFGERLQILAAFADGAGCKMMFDKAGFELYSRSSAYGKLLFKVAA